ncbi:unnamed protein product [Cuscuta epithymum]|uniref:Uncharacterized protein n=1 Tax=Cuscuta epithymum TaxID=186058 RepID=A0AAV0EPM8_9ASTE|nr:unnamed protein product [Cuscuta epithymum]
MLWRLTPITFLRFLQNVKGNNNIHPKFLKVKCDSLDSILLVVSAMAVRKLHSKIQDIQKFSHLGKGIVQSFFLGRQTK